MSRNIQSGDFTTASQEICINVKSFQHFTISFLIIKAYSTKNSIKKINISKYLNFHGDYIIIMGQGGDTQSLYVYQSATKFKFPTWFMCLCAAKTDLTWTSEGTAWCLVQANLLSPVKCDVRPPYIKLGPAHKCWLYCYPGNLVSKSISWSIYHVPQTTSKQCFQCWKCIVPLKEVILHLRRGLPALHYNEMINVFCCTREF